MSTQLTEQPLTLCSTEEEMLQKVDVIVEKIGKKEQHIVEILHHIQEEFQYLPLPALKRVCEISAITPAQITGVSTFYKQFRHQPVGKHLIRVCTGTACHVKNARGIYESFLKEMGFTDAHAGESLTDKNGTFSIEEVACIGCCALAPVAQIDEEAYGPLLDSQIKDVLDEVENKPEEEKTHKIYDQSHLPPDAPEIRIELDTSCIAKGADKVYDALIEHVSKEKLPVRVKSVACIGLSTMSPIVTISGLEKEDIVYSEVQEHDVKALLYRHFAPNLMKRIGFKISKKIDEMLNDQYWNGLDSRQIKEESEVSLKFLDQQVRIATEHTGMNDPLDLKEYCDHDGFKALNIALAMQGKEVIQVIKDSGLRGRGGGGFPTGTKWGLVNQQKEMKRYVICNGDEGDPGAFMDRMLMESFPFRILEGLMVSALAVGADEGLVYLRAEYPLAVERIQAAIDILYKEGYLGNNILGTDFSLDLKIFRGAGAFICGEETAMIASIEGGRGVPNTRPPYPAESGLWGKPTLINNVETLANISWVLRNGAEAFSKIGTEKSKGTKVFALAGKVQRSGLIEVPMGTTIRTIVNEIGGGVEPDRHFKAIQIGGPSGGCIPERLADTPIDYEELKSLGAIMGSGGLIVLDDKDCMVEIARYFLQFTKEESCGQCSIGRLGTTRLLEMMTRLCEGKANQKDVQELKELGEIVQQGSLCGLCKTAPNPLLTALKYFPDEIQAHIDGRCPAGQCKSLIHYVIKDNCIGCTRCAQYCPTDSIPMLPFRKHEIIDETCIRCDKCYEVCPEDAVFIV